MENQQNNEVASEVRNAELQARAARVTNANLGTIDGGEYVASRIFDEVRQIHFIGVILLKGTALKILPGMKDASNWRWTDDFGWQYESALGWIEIYPNHMTNALTEAFNLPTGY